MTENEWLMATDPLPMLVFAFPKTSRRKLYLLACACCRPLWHLMTDERQRRFVEVFERYADGQVTSNEARFAWLGCKNVKGQASETLRALGMAVNHISFVGSVICNAQTVAGYGGSDPATVMQSQAALFRDIVGNPFRPAVFDPAWRTPTLTNLAQAVYDDRHLPSGLFDNHRLSVLGDALEEAGCHDPDLLAHCRSEGNHPRGCFLVDLLLGKE